MPPRTAALWCPDWPVVARRVRDDGLRGVPVVVTERTPRGERVRAASPEARVEGVVTGLLRREAEARCPGVVLLDADTHVDAAAFEVVALAVETFTPRLALDVPGRLAFPTRGPARYFGGEAALGARVLAAVAAAGVPDARLGVADGGFAAELAARAAAPGRAQVVAAGAAPAFLAEWPVAALGDPALADLLTRLGLSTLGAFAALPAASVLGRFGTEGSRAHRLARGLDPLVSAWTVPPPELAETIELDPPVEQVETAAFVAKSLATQLLARLDRLGLGCSRVTIEAETEHGERLARCWRHEGALTPDALAARVRWQLEGWLHASGGLSGGLALLRLLPDEVAPATGRQLGFWGDDPHASDRAARALARVQGMLGHPAVVTAVPQGGRTPVERVRWVPWGDPREPARPGSEPSVRRAPGESPPWPGAIPGPSPARVFDPPRPAALLAADGVAVTVSARGEASAPPAVLRCDALPGGGGDVLGWAGPWAHDLRWWDGSTRVRCTRWQVALVSDVACLVRVARTEAAVEAIYD